MPCGHLDVLSLPVFAEILDHACVRRSSIRSGSVQMEVVGTLTLKQNGDECVFLNDLILEGLEKNMGASWTSSGQVECGLVPSSSCASDLALDAERVEFEHHLRLPGADPKADRKREDDECLGGMARTSRAVAALPGHLVLGGRLRRALDDFVRLRPHVVQDCLSALGSDDPAAGPRECDLRDVRELLGGLLGASSTEAVAAGDVTSPVRAGLLHAWATQAGDPGASAALWLVNGAPAGILDLPLLAGVFPLAQQKDDFVDPEFLEVAPERFKNYSGMDDDEEVLEQIEGFVAKGYMKKFDDFSSCSAFLGAPPVLSRFGVVSKVRFGKLKRRLILDVKQSNVKLSTRRVHRVPLPRATDVIYDWAHMMQTPMLEDESVEFMVLDFTDAYWNIPLAPAERRFFVGSLRGKFYVFLRAAQGSRNGPLAWAGVISLVQRLAQSLFWEQGACTLRLNTYVDDPIAVIRGSTPARNLRKCLLILVWRALGLPLAFPKAATGQTLDWIGLKMSVTETEIDCTISAQRVQEMRELTEEGLAKNVLPRRWLQTYAGKANAFASLLVLWRPFLSFLWGALYDPSQCSGAPPGCIWARQIHVSLRWIRAFLLNMADELHRRFRLEDLRGTGPAVAMTFDASPWGAGGYLEIDGQIVAWYAAEFNAADSSALGGVVFGVSDAQQIAEALAILFGLRAWAPRLAGRSARLCVRSDSVSALTLVAKMRSKTPQSSTIARELALSMAIHGIRPRIVAHTPGVANVLADALSRRFQPGACWKLPAALGEVPETIVDPMRNDYYLTVGQPTAEQRVD